MTKQQRGWTLIAALAFLAVMITATVLGMRFVNQLKQNQRFDALTRQQASEFRILANCAGPHFISIRDTMAVNTRVQLRPSNLPCVDATFGATGSGPGRSPFGSPYVAWGIRDNDDIVRLVLSDTGGLRSGPIDAIGKEVNTADARAAAYSAIARGIAARGVEHYQLVIGIVRSGTRVMRGVNASFQQDLSNYLFSAPSRDTVVVLWGWPEYNTGGDIIRPPDPPDELAYSRCDIMPARPQPFPASGVNWDSGTTMPATSGSCPSGWDEIYRYRACMPPDRLVVLTAPAGDTLVFGRQTVGSGTTIGDDRELYSTFALSGQHLGEVKCGQDGVVPGPRPPFCLTSTCPYNTPVDSSATSVWCCERR